MEYGPGTDEEFAKALEELMKDGTMPPEESLSFPHSPSEGGERYQIKDISNTHEAVLNWLILNPQKPLSACAREFGYTQAWLSTLMHSDLFQAKLREKQGQVFNTAVLNLKEKLEVLADVSVSKLITEVERSNDPKFLKEVAKDAMASLGFGSKAPALNPLTQQTNVQNNFYVASPEDLVSARARMAQRSGGLVSTPEETPLLSDDATPSPMARGPQTPTDAEEIPLESGNLLLNGDQDGNA